MRRFKQIAGSLLVVAATGCSASSDWRHESRSLTAEQQQRQQAIITTENLLVRHPELIGANAGEYAELFALANERSVRGDDVVYIFYTPGASDDGSKGRFRIQVEAGTIVEVEHAFTED